MDKEIEVVDDFKVLCIIINKHIRWQSHTELIVNKISKFIGVTNKLKHTLPLHIMRILYNTLILPHLCYGILLWGHDKTRLHMLQKRDIGTMIISEYNAHTEPLRKTLKNV